MYLEEQLNGFFKQHQAVRVVATHMNTLILPEETVAQGSESAGPTVIISRRSSTNKGALGSEVGSRRSEVRRGRVNCLCWKWPTATTIRNVLLSHTRKLAVSLKKPICHPDNL